jgi:large subunit ribosomal protein L17
MLKRNLITSLLLYENMRTTKKRAAVITPEIDKIITFAKNHTPHVAIRHINTIVTDKNASKKIMEVYINRFAKKSSGLTRTKAVGSRDGDGAELVDISFVDSPTKTS